MNPLLTQDHPYHCTADAVETFDTLDGFLDEYEDADIDLNLCWRWDISIADEDDPSKGFSGRVFIIRQRHGIFAPIDIDSVLPEHLPRFKRYLEKHWSRLKEMWAPISLEGRE